MTAAEISFQNECLLCDRSGALIWPDEETVVVSDLHFEKGSALAERGVLLPPYDTRDTLYRLSEIFDRYPARRAICLGDSFHDQSAFERMAEEEISTIRDLTSAREWIWIAGNHDPSPPETLGGKVSHELAIRNLTFRHIARRATAPGEISGHHHPKARVPVRGRRLSAPCFVTDEEKIILPAFGTYTGGLDTTDIAISGLFENGYTVHMLGNRKVHSFPQSALTKSREKLPNQA